MTHAVIDMFPILHLCHLIVNILKMMMDNEYPKRVYYSVHHFPQVLCNLFHLFEVSYFFPVFITIKHKDVDTEETNNIIQV